MQSLVRAEVLASARGRGTGLALDGRASAGTTLREWLSQPTMPVDPRSRRYFAEFYRRRPDLHHVYQGVRTGDVHGYLYWAELIGIQSDALPRWIVEAGNALAGRGAARRDTRPVCRVPAAARAWCGGRRVS